MALPRTFLGWRRVFWLALRCCPIHHRFLSIDPWNPDEMIGYCFDCEDIAMWPLGLVATLRSNKKRSEAARG